MSSLPVHYAAAAVNRAQRLNFASGAVWRYPAQEKSKGVLLLIHGFRGNHHGLESIAGALPDWEIFIPDLPGFGASERPPAITLDNYSQWLTGLYEQMPESTIPIAHSFGKDIASKAVRRYYTLAKNNPSILKSKVFIDLMNSVLIKTKAKDLKRWIAKQHQENFSDFSSAEVAIKGFEVAGKHTVSDYAPQIQTKVMLITGAKDSVGAYADQKKLNRLFPSSEFHSIPQLGHLLHYEAPYELAKLIEEFID
jgi:pimeloyl-ACP methyl ester carboxylesterase